ncbi:hypothetical protein AV530_006930 [Patagioenas fasciata monilis]|uniref:Uncharacterized protein n=1 Tax=Patagioenas fasciata monilis TaxID=372326 RepID=A0A1V4JZU8_PATFA|nr:hypothetical protein AV530_006930 [Patagioenas fasciata monilis]
MLSQGNAWLCRRGWAKRGPGSPEPSSLGSHGPPNPPLPPVGRQQPLPLQPGLGEQLHTYTPHRFWLNGARVQLGEDETLTESMVRKVEPPPAQRLSLPRSRLRPPASASSEPEAQGSKTSPGSERYRGEDANPSRSSFSPDTNGCEFAERPGVPGTFPRRRRRAEAGNSLQSGQKLLLGS